ncbi:glycosyltransferase [Dolichospermum sp. ST_sed3]|nr:glycosyltransferase [Dolichospermum sp. ST_sed3]
MVSNKLIYNSKGCIIITGMHRSGASSLTSYLINNGVDFGVKLQEYDKYTPNGYLEDIDFVRFHSIVLRYICRTGVKGWHDWGYTEDHVFNSAGIEQFRETAIELLGRKQKLKNLWGWCDPRTTLLLDFWISLLPNAYFILLYRNPWEVKRLIERINEPVFNSNPQYAYDIWYIYNSRLLEFYKKYPDQCLLISYNHFIQNPQRFAEKLNEKFSITPLLNSNKDTSFYKHDQVTTYDFQQQIKEFKENSVFMNLFHELNYLEDMKPEISYPETNTPKVSVVIPCYNQGEYLPEALSCIESSLSNFYEIIIVNDGSDDPLTLITLKQLEEQGYHVLNQENSGLATARNNGIALAKAPYILPLDADNRADTEYLLKAIQILDNDPAIGVVYANPRYFGERKELFPLPDFDIHRFLAVNDIGACAVFRKELWEKSGGFDPHMPLMGYEDWEFWIRLAKQGVKFYHINEFLFDYRIRKDSMVSICNLPENRQKLVDYICEKHVDFYKQHALGIVSYLTRNLAETEQLYSKQNQSFTYLTQYSRMLHETVKEYETRLHYIEVSKFWKLKQLYDKVKFILSSESYTKNKKNKWFAKIRFLLSSAGLRMIFKLFRKIFRVLQQLVIKKLWGRIKHP